MVGMPRGGKVLPLPKSYRGLPPSVYNKIKDNARRGQRELRIATIAYVAGVALWVIIWVVIALTVFMG